MESLTRSITSDSTFEAADQFLERLREGDESVFLEVFRLYKDMVYTLSLKLLVDKSESMDVTQEVFISLLRNASGFRGDCCIKTWLYRVTVNQIANRNRWWKRCWRSQTVSLSVPVSADDPRPLEVEGRSPSPARNILNSELRGALEQGLRKLPFEQRVAIVLRDVEGLTYEEIAEVTGVNLGTVKSRIGRAREQLREMLRVFQGGEDL